MAAAAATQTRCTQHTKQRNSSTRERNYGRTRQGELAKEGRPGLFIDPATARNHWQKGKGETHLTQPICMSYIDV